MSFFIKGHERQPKLPLLRVRVEYTDEAQCFNTIRFGQKYQSRVANPDDMILLKREKTTQRKSRENDEDDKENMQQFLQNEEVSICTVRCYNNTYMMRQDL